MLRSFLRVDDHNLYERYAFFYKEIAPKIRLYAIPVGSEVVLRGVSKTGYLKALRLKVYGTYRFRGLEESDLAASQNLVDLQSFRELYGVMTAAKQAELATIRAEVGIQDLERSNAEDALFGEHAELGIEEGISVGFEDVSEEQVMREVAAAQDQGSEVGVEGHGKKTAGSDHGLVINAAVLLKNDKLLKQSQAELEQLLEEKGFSLQVVDWQSAAGIVGQFIHVLRLILYIAIAIIFGVALVIINNSMVMATVERVGEVGTMRAMGAQRTFVMLLFLVETMMLGLLAGLCGSVAGAAFITYLGQVGIPATHDVMYFLFSGPRLLPNFGPSNLITGFGVILVVSLGSTLYPAWIATRIQPAVAMGSE